MLGRTEPSWLSATACNLQAREAHPRRWARHTRNWQPIEAVTLNPDPESPVRADLTEVDKTISAA